MSFVSNFISMIITCNIVHVYTTLYIERHDNDYSYFVVPGPFKLSVQQARSCPVGFVQVVGLLNSHFNSSSPHCLYAGGIRKRFTISYSALKLGAYRVPSCGTLIKKTSF